MDTHQGSCLCGEITFEVTGQPIRQGNCHCTACKKATGAAYATIVFFKEDQISQLSGETKSYEYISDKGNTKRKMFCQKCGSIVFGNNTGRPGIRSVYAGTFDDASFVKPTFNVYTSRAFPFVPIDEKLDSYSEGN